MDSVERIAGMLIRLTEEVVEARRQRDTLRAILSPLITDPYRDDGAGLVCIHCDARGARRGEVGHAGECVVLRGDLEELLGRGDASSG